MSRLLPYAAILNFPICPESARRKKLSYGSISPLPLARRPSRFNCKLGVLDAFLVITLITPPMASAPYLADAAPLMISIRSTFSVPRRWSSSPCPLYLDISPITGCPSTRINVCLGSAPRMDTPTRPMASTLLVTPVSLNIISSTDFACFLAISSAVMIVVCWLSYFASSCARFASTLTSLVVI